MPSLMSSCVVLIVELNKIIIDPKTDIFRKKKPVIDAEVTAVSLVDRHGNTIESSTSDYVEPTNPNDKVGRGVGSQTPQENYILTSDFATI